MLTKRLLANCAFLPKCAAIYSLIFLAAGCPGVSAATLLGTALDDNGKAVAGAVVRLTASPPGPGRSAQVVAASALASPVTATVGVSNGGEFAFSDIAPGRYWLCLAPNDRIHVDSCASRIGAQYLSVSDGATAQVNVTVTVGTEILVALLPMSSASALPTVAFLSSDRGTFCPMQNDTTAGHFWAVVPPLSSWRLVTATPGGAVSLPTESIQAGAAGAPVSVIASR